MCPAASMCEKAGVGVGISGKIFNESLLHFLSLIFALPLHFTSFYHTAFCRSIVLAWSSHCTPAAAAVASSFGEAFRMLVPGSLLVVAGTALASSLTDSTLVAAVAAVADFMRRLLVVAVCAALWCPRFFC